MTRARVRILMKVHPGLRRIVYKAIHPSQVAQWEAMRLERQANDLYFEPILSKRVLFIHIPKCAGTSVNKAIFGGTTGSHLPLWKYEMAFTRREMQSLWKFTFFRNPFDRVLSAYRFLMKGGFIPADAQLRDDYFPDADFNEFVKGALVRREVQRHILFREQTEFVDSGTSKRPLDFVGFFERFDADFVSVLRQLKIGQERATIRENNSTESPVDYRSVYNSESVDIVSRLYGKDVATLGYSFDEPFSDSQMAKVSKILVGASI